MRYLILAALAATLGTAASAHATQFVVNGDFTDLTSGVGQLGTNTNAAGWDPNGGYNFVFTNGGDAVPQGGSTLALWAASNGGSSDWNGLTKSGTGNFAAMDGAFETEALTQTITGLTVGKTYTFSFNYAFGQQDGFDGATIQNLTASLGGFTVTVPAGDEHLANHGFSGWDTFTTTITANDSTETLSFLAFGNLPVPPFALVSDVSLTGSVPEASTWAMMLIGFGGVAFAAFRSRRRVAATA
jgi:hypothetical protein